MDATFVLPAPRRISDVSRVDREASQALVKASLRALADQRMPTPEVSHLKRALEAKRVKDLGDALTPMKLKRQKVAQEKRQPLSLIPLPNLDSDSDG